MGREQHSIISDIKARVGRLACSEPVPVQLKEAKSEAIAGFDSNSGRRDCRARGGDWRWCLGPASIEEFIAGMR